MVNPMIETKIALVDENVEQKDRELNPATEAVTIKNVEIYIKDGIINAGMADDPEKEPTN
jgi:hypothetical protein